MSKLNLLIARLGYLTSLVLISNFVVIGVIASYFNIPELYWLGFIVPLALFFEKNNYLKTANKSTFLISVWFIYLILNWLFLTTGAQLKIVALKDYIIPTFSLLIVSKLKFDDKQLDSIYKILRIIVLIQPPLILHQFFFLARNSSARSFDWDLISGSFGFNPDGGGGNSGGLLLLLSFYLVISISRIKSGIKQNLDYIAIIACLLSFFLMETKVIILLIFLMTVSLIDKKKIINPLYSIKYLFASIFLIASILMVYNANFSVGEKEGRNINEYIEDIKDSYFEESFLNFETGEITRQASVKIWIEKNITDINFGSFFGYGLTSSKFSNADKYEALIYGSRLNIANTQITTYLWDTGLFGIFILALIIRRRFRYFYRLTTSFSNIEAFRRGALFLSLSFLIYPYYSNTLHQNPASFTIFILFTAMNFKDKLSNEVKYS